VDSRPTAPQSRHLGAYEVVFAVSPLAGEQVEKGRTPALQQAAGPRDGNIERSFAELRRELYRMREEVARTGTLSGAASNALSDPHIAKLYGELLSRDFTAEFAQELALEVSPYVGRELPPEQRLGQLRSLAAIELSRRLARTQGQAKKSGGRSTGPHVIALFGPPGCGKTTSLVKLAVKLGVSRRKAVQILSLDNFRVGAAEQLRAYCTILGVAFQQVEGPMQLAAALAGCRGKSVMLIDSPGFGPQEEDLIAELGRALTALPSVERHLVISAVAKANDLRLTIDRFAVCAPHYLLLTHLDETDARGGVVSVSAARNIPVSYLCNGQRIPEDLEPVTAERLAEAAWEWRDTGPEWETGRQAGSAAAGLG